MTQSGLSRELFESWCTDARNCCIVAGYCVEGTMAKYILSEPEDVPTMSPGSRLPLKMKVSSISFSAHADFKQTSNFIRYGRTTRRCSGIYFKRVIFYGKRQHIKLKGIKTFHHGQQILTACSSFLSSW